MQRYPPRPTNLANCAVFQVLFSHISYFKLRACVWVQKHVFFYLLQPHPSNATSDSRFKIRKKLPESKRAGQDLKIQEKNLESKGTSALNLES